MHILQLFHFFLLQSLQLNAYFFSHLDVLSLGKVLIMQDVDIGHALSLQVSLELGAPTC